MKSNIENDVKNDVDNKAHIKEIYLERATKLLKISIGVFIFSFITYFIPLLYGAFDFGLIFEILSFVFLLLAFFKLKSKDTKTAKTHLIIAMIPVGWLIIYDFINLLANLPEVMTEVFYYYANLDFLFYHLAPYLVDVVLIANLILLYLSFSSIKKADGEIKPQNLTEEFYDKL